MYSTNYPSKYLDEAVKEFASLPGIGEKTALRLVLNLLKREESEVVGFANSLINLKTNVKQCKVCHNISDVEVCNICSDNSRNKTLVCVVENIRDILAIEKTGQFTGVYHVLGGVISPMDGIGPSDLKIDSLELKIQNREVTEVILALSTTMEGDTTNFFINKRLAPYGIDVSILARGVAIGNELQYTDDITLGRSIINRVPFGK